MFRNVPWAITEEKEFENNYQIFERDFRYLWHRSSSGTNTIEIEQKKSKVWPVLCSWGLLLQRPMFVFSGYSNSILVTAPSVACSIARALRGRTGLPVAARHAVVAGISLANAKAFIDCFLYFKKSISFIAEGLFH